MGQHYWRKGQATDLGITVFTEGDCWILAYQLHWLTGWPVVRIDPIDNPEHVDSAHHYAVRAPSGYLVDVTGVTTRAVMCRRWETSSIVLASDEFYEFCASARERNLSDFPDSWRRSATVARQLLEAHGVRGEE